VSAGILVKLVVAARDLMALEFIPTRAAAGRNDLLDQLVAKLRGDCDALGLGDGVLYLGWPKFTDYDAVRHYVDLALITQKTGVVFVRVLAAANAQTIADAKETLSQVSAGAVSQLVKSPRLRQRRQLKVPVTPIFYSPGLVGENDEIETIGSEPVLMRFLQEISDSNLSDEEMEEIRSIFEGAKALVRINKRLIENPAEDLLAVALAALEDEIATFDARQRQVALLALGGPQRIRGLAGSGKTVILAMKAALAHLDDPSANVLVTYYTRSLRDQLIRLITRFYRHFGEGDPDWNRIHVHHGWGRRDLPGVLREASLRADISPMNYGAAVQGAKGKSPFDFACRSLLESGRVKPFYDLILIDEGQDFPDGFYQLCFSLAKGSRDHKQIVGVYDELKNFFDVPVRSPAELFGQDEDGEPRISLDRALPVGVETNDFVLSKCYRNQRDILVLAHALGFGVYGTQVQTLQNREHWEDVGYEVLEGSFRPNTAVVVSRPDRNSPAKLETPAAVPLVEANQFDSVRAEVEYCANEFQRFVNGGLQPEDLMAVAIDDRAAQTYLSLLSEALADRGIPVNNIVADRYSEPAFRIDGKVTLTTVYRAKGNEAAVVAVLGCDAVPLTSRNGRNRLFTAFTRSKGWLRITGMGHKFAALRGEIYRALEFAPRMEFLMGDPQQLELIQRDLSERDARLQRAQAEMDRVKEQLGLTDDDLRSLFGPRDA